MKKNILVLTGSPRKGGNSDTLADAFIKGALEKGHAVTKVATAFKNILGCRACNACYSNGNACIFKDDFNEVAPHLENADTIVLATPLYWYTFPSSLKAVLDKMYALIVGKRPSNIKESFLLVCGEDHDPHIFDGIIKSYQLIAANRQWKETGIIAVTGVRDPGDILQTDAVKKTEEMGRNL